MAENELYIGLISGTSVDGVDSVLVNFQQNTPELIASHSHPIEDPLRRNILALCLGEDIRLSELGQTHIELGKIFAEAANAVLNKAGVGPKAVTAIGSHGQTVWHEPDAGNPFTLQLADANTIAQRTGITTVADMRGRDISAGGQGAPLAPLLHQHIFASSSENRAIINIGGISNITCLRQGTKPIAFDAGPGNVLMDFWIDKHQQKKYDEGGVWASSGTVHNELLQLCKNEPYFSRALPKSTGRELFNGSWLENKLAQCQGAIRPQDVQATMLQLTVDTIVDALDPHCQSLFICGGGAHNRALMQGLAQARPNCTVASTLTLGVDPDWVEAIAFAWIARETCAGRKIDTSVFTGASEAVILGGIYQA